MIVQVDASTTQLSAPQNIIPSSSYSTPKFAFFYLAQNAEGRARFQVGAVEQNKGKEKTLCSPLGLLDTFLKRYWTWREVVYTACGSHLRGYYKPCFR